MWILIESGRWVNLDMVSDITKNEIQKVATLMSSGVLIAHSQIAYQKIYVDGILEAK